MKRFKDLKSSGDTVWKLYISEDKSIIKLEELVTVEAIALNEELHKFKVTLDNHACIRMTEKVANSSSIQFDDGSSYYCDRDDLLQRIDKHEDLVTSWLTTASERTYHYVEQMFAEVYETI